jgi:demethylmenaquinone methyltransferase/2-methoxy-6-polyprenyl-1,4-benzoquinol methylase
VKAYYDARAPEYDEWYLGAGRFAERDRPFWGEELEQVVGVVAALPPARTLDVACGTGFLTRHLRGEVVGLDQSARMLELASRHVDVVQGEALELPFPDDAFERIFTASFYGHLEPGERERFLAEARRVAPELVVVDAALRDDVPPEQVEERMLRDGSRWHVYKRYFTPEDLAAELGGGRVLHAGRWFVAVAA